MFCVQSNALIITHNIFLNPMVCQSDDSLTDPAAQPFTKQTPGTRAGDGLSQYTTFKIFLNNKC